jgi:hypothetical protein
VSERQDAMGAGNKVQIIARGGKIKHDDMQPWETIGARCGKDVFKGALEATCNKWTGRRAGLSHVSRGGPRRRAASGNAPTRPAPARR